MLNSLLRNCIYQGKSYYRDKAAFFWTLLYPLILGTFFYMTLNGVLNQQIDNINVGISKENPLESIVEQIDIIHVQYLLESEVTKYLEEGKIDGYIDNNFNLVVKESGINQTIIKEILEQVKQMEILNRPVSDYDFTINYIKDKNQKANSIMIIFYSLIAMFSTYGVFGGIETVSLNQANLTHLGARIHSSPLKSRDFLLAGILVTLLLNLMSNGILLLCIKYIFKFDLFKELKYSFAFILLGNLFGVSLGVLIGASNKKSGGVKSMMGIVSTLFLSFLSGMMNPEIKILVDKHAPFLGKVNPIAVITSNLYKINSLENTDSAMVGIRTLLVSCLVLITISYFFLRRKTYDSI